MPKNSPASKKQPTASKVGKAASKAALAIAPKPCKVCAWCGGEKEDKGNKILKCDGEGCGRSRHMRCLPVPLSKVPTGGWLCPQCDQASQCCNWCGKDEEEGNTILLCDGEGCGGAWHMRCLPFPLDEVPEGDWLCPECRYDTARRPPCRGGAAPRARTPPPLLTARRRAAATPTPSA
jgi:hypothetical protein